MTGHNPSEGDIVERLQRLLPVSWDTETDGHGEPTHAVLTFGEHQTQAITMCPDDWMLLNELPAEITRLRELLRISPAMEGDHPLAQMTRLDEEMGLYDDPVPVRLAGLEGAEDWEVGPCVDRLGNVTSWDISIKPEPGARGVAVIASVYSGEKVANAILAAVKLNIANYESTLPPSPKGMR